MAMMERAREMAAKTPPQRNRYVDFLRAISITVVVFGHWLMVVVTIQDGEIVAGHLLAEAPSTQLLTWIFQVMPVFFMVGGYSNAASWSAAERNDIGYGNWLRSRCQRLLGPTAIFALAWVPITILAQIAVESSEVLAVMGGFVAVPLWFLAVYVMVIPLAPAMLYLHRRFGLAVPAIIALAVVILDIIDMYFLAPHAKFDVTIAWANYAFVWLTVHQIGFFWQEGRLEIVARTKLWLTLAGLGGMVALTASGLYPLSMIGVPGTGRTNNTPPTIILILLAMFQMGLILISSPWAKKRLESVDLWARTIIANGMIMTVYLWHLTASAVVVFIGVTFGIGFKLEALSPGWWSMRLVWLAALSVVLILFVAVFARFERPNPPTMVARGWRSAIITCAGALLAGMGLAALALEGFYTPDKPWGVPVGTLLMLLFGAAAVGVTPGIYLRRH
jgi:hypothetical protein